MNSLSTCVLKQFLAVKGAPYGSSGHAVHWPMGRFAVGGDGRKTKEFGYDGIELACWGDHFEVDKALADDSYCSRKRELLATTRPAMSGDQRSPGRPGGPGPDRRTTQGDRAALRVGRRQSGRRDPASDRRVEEHAPVPRRSLGSASSMVSPARASGTSTTRFRPCRRR